MLRECEYVSWAIFFAIQFVKHLDLIVVRQQDGELVVSHLNSLEHCPRPTHHLAARYVIVTTLNDEPHAHDRTTQVSREE